MTLTQKFLPQVTKAEAKEERKRQCYGNYLGLNKMSFQIVRYSSKYQKAVIDLWKKCDLIVPQNDPVEDIQKKLEFQPQLFLIALLDGQLIGSVMVGYEGHRGWLNYLAILPNYQKQGYGKKLVFKAIDELKKFGCLKVNVQIRKNNPSAIEFYKHVGFKDDNVIGLGMRLK
jgi:ribosomal protein S18 acetylase RimI-like enzyme